jgi:tight adherence protein B
MTSTQTQELFALFGFIIILVVLALVSLKSVMDSISRKEKFEARIMGATSEVQKPTNLADEQVSLAKTVTRSELIQMRAANIIGVDLQQADAYPVKWWLVPPAALLISWIIVFLASHPLGHALLLYVFLWPVAWFIVTKSLFTWFNNRRNAVLLQQFPDALGTVVRCVRVGIPMGEALRTVSMDAPEPTKAEFTILADKVSIGIPLDVALRELSIRIKLTEYQFFATAITLQMRAGGAITQTLETLADVIRKRVALKARGYALTSEARTSSMILLVLPFIAGIALFFMQRSYIMLLFTTKSGESCLGLAILLMGLGIGSIQFLINSVLK